MRATVVFMMATLLGCSNVSVVIPVDGPIGIKIESEKEIESVIVNDKYSSSDTNVGE